MRVRPAQLWWSAWRVGIRFGAPDRACQQHAWTYARLWSAAASASSVSIKDTCVLSEAGNTFTCASVTFKGLDVYLAAEAATEAARHACAALSSDNKLHLASGASPPQPAHGHVQPTCLLVFTSVPEPLLQPLLSAVQEAAPQTPIAGCSTSRLTCATSRAGGPARNSGFYHVTVTAAHLPRLRADVFQAKEDSMPIIPDLPSALSSRPPQFIVFAAHDRFLGLKDRFENLFGENACLAVASAAQTLYFRRTAVLLPGLPTAVSFSTAEPPSLGDGKGTDWTIGAGGCAGNSSDGPNSREGYRNEGTGGDWGRTEDTEQGHGSEGRESRGSKWGDHGPSNWGRTSHSVWLDGLECQTSGLYPDNGQGQQYVQGFRAVCEPSGPASHANPCFTPGSTPATKSSASRNPGVGAGSPHASHVHRSAKAAYAGPGSGGRVGVGLAAVSVNGQVMDELSNLHDSNNSGSSGGNSSSGSDRGGGSNSTSPPAPVVFCGQELLHTGCTGLILSPLERQSDHLPTEATAALARVMLGQDRFCTLELQPAAMAQLQPSATSPDGNFVDVPWPSAMVDPACWVAACIPPLPTARMRRHGSETGAEAGATSWSGRRLGQLRVPPQRPSAHNTNSLHPSPHWHHQHQQLQQQPQDSLRGIPIFEIGRDFVLFPGQQAQLRIFEKRYQLLMKALIENGGCFGFPIERELGMTAAVRRYSLNGSEFYVVIEGGHRFAYRSKSCRIIPGTFGLAAVSGALVHDEPEAEYGAQELVAVANQVLTALHYDAAAERASQAVSMLFASALHFTSASPGGTAATAARAAAGRASSHPSSSSLSEAGAADAFTAEAKARMTPARASALSLYLAACMPVDLETKRAWLGSFSALERLRQQYRRLHQQNNLRLATVAEVMRQPRDHLLRDLVNLPYVQFDEA